MLFIEFFISKCRQFPWDLLDELHHLNYYNNLTRNIPTKNAFATKQELAHRKSSHTSKHISC